MTKPLMSLRPTSNEGFTTEIISTIQGGAEKNAPELRLHRFGRIPHSSPLCPSDAILDRLAMNTPIHSACRSWVSFSGRENFQTKFGSFQPSRLSSYK